MIRTVNNKISIENKKREQTGITKVLHEFKSKCWSRIGFCRTIKVTDARKDRRHHLKFMVSESSLRVSYSN